MGIISNNIKVSFLNFNFQERQRTHRDQCATVQTFNYEFSRNINAYGRAYGGSSGGMVTLTLRAGTRFEFRDYYECLTMNEPRAFSLIYNAVFDDYGVLSDYDGGIIISGYVVSLDEIYNRKRADTEGEQMFLKMDILISKIGYVGVNNSLDMSFTQ